MKLFRLECLVFVVASMILSWNLWNVGIASGYIDPIRHLGAQDEATYTREAIAMAREGGWMTPTFLGRWVFEKPPLLMWLSAASMKTFGIGRVTARLPAILAGALLCALCFAMVRRERSLYAGLAAALMALGSQVLFTMARHNMTDILFAAAGMCAFAILLRDPDLRSSANLAGFVIAAAAGIMAKSIAGVLVLAVMIVLTGLARKRWARASLAFAAAIALASPWFLYNFILHRDWFLADMGFQIVTIGTTAHQTADENHVWFYFIRILNSDLLPLLLTITACPALFRAVRKREPAAVLAISYFAIYLAALMVFRFHSEQYLCWFVPSLILIGALYSPLMTTRGAIGIFLVALIVFITISMRPVTTIPAAPALSRYCTEHRATDLYILGVDDEFYSAVLPLHSVRYGFIDAEDVVAREHPHLTFLGLLIPATELAQLDSKLPIYRGRLRAWGLESTKAVATGIFAHDAATLAQIIHDHPESDFLVARSVLADPEHTTSHRLAFANTDFALLESKLPVAAESAGWTCEM
jgi:hypothetical protein